MPTRKPLYLFNTMTRKKELFVPLDTTGAGVVTMYTCGPTVYHFAHIGNLRSYVFADTLKRTLIANGYNVKHVMNITDVGQLTDDDNLSDSGEDKMEKAARRDSKTAWDVAKFYTNAFLKDSADLNLLEPMARPRATAYIQEQIDMVKRLEELGYTYKIDGDGIYYDTSKFPEYGRLGGQALDELKAGARIELSAGKRNITDFALWKFYTDDKPHDMEWNSPWGKGFPGWHIECSAMSLALLGERMDIHTGGIDAIKIHHTNEIAQTEPVVGHKWVNFWVHGEFLNDKTGKMSKSKGEFLTLSLLKDKGFSPMAYRYYLLLASYRSQINFSFELLESAQNGYNNLLKKVSNIIAATDAYDLTDANTNANANADADTAKIWTDKMIDCLNNDLATPEAIVVLQDALKDANISNSAKLSIVDFADNVLGLRLIENAKKIAENSTDTGDIPADILQMIDARKAAKAARDFASADKIRADIKTKGFEIIDNPDGTFSVKKK